MKVIIDRRKSERRARDGSEGAADQREIRDRRRPRVVGDFPPIETAAEE